jgi:phage terminase large subunit-like protein
VPHVKGALAGQPIELMDWHIFILINIFGFVIPLVNEETGEIVLRNDGSGRPVMVRRFRTAYNEVARKNAKSTLSSGVGLYMTGADSEGGAEVYSAATTRDQARIVFEDAKTWSKRPSQRWANCLSSINSLFTRSKPPPNLSRFFRCK